MTYSQGPGYWRCRGRQLGVTAEGGSSNRFVAWRFARSLGVRAATVLIFAVGLGASAHRAQAGINVWTTHGPYGGRVNVLALDPATSSTVYAGIDGGGVFKSNNNGTSWSAINAGLSGNALSVNALAINPTTPNTIYAGTFAGVFMSTNGGGNWHRIGFALTDPSATPLSVQVLAIDPATPSTLYAGTWGEGVYYIGSVGAGLFKSTNSGASWSNTGLTDPGGTALDVYNLAIDPSTPSTLYAGTGGGVFRSTNSGGSWSAVSSGLADPRGNTFGVSALDIDPTTPSTLYAGTVGGVFKSTDGGGSWHRVSFGLTDSSRNIFGISTLAIDPATPSTLYAGTYRDGV